MKRKLSILFFVFLLLGGGYFSYQAIKIDLKAKIAQILLNHAWQQSLKNGEGAQPWPSFDGRPIFKLVITKHQVSQIVLDGTSGQSLAFGPGFHSETHLPYMNKTTAISSHRDSHGNFIKKLIVGDEIQLQDLHKQWHYYIVDDFFIINVHDQKQITNTKSLLLITCYPFNAITSGTPLRYIVSARKIIKNNTKDQSFS